MSQGTAANSPSAPELSLDEWFALPEDEPGELVDGRLEEEEAADYLHELLVVRLVAGSEAKLAIGSGRGRKPDLTVYLPAAVAHRPAA